MATEIHCICGYVGPSIQQGNRIVCPICHSEPGKADAPLPSIAGVGQSTARGAGGSDVINSSIGSLAHYRIPCPKGHVNKTPAKMLGTQGTCPKCHERYLISIHDSLEHREEIARRQAVLDERFARKWLRRSIIAVLLVVLSLAMMLGYSISSARRRRR